MREEIQELIGNIGSFYGEHLQASDVARLRRLTRDSAHCARLDTVDRLAAETIGFGSYVRENFTIAFERSNVVGIAFDRFGKVGDARARIGDMAEFDAWLHEVALERPDGDVWVAIPLPGGIVPVLIFAGGINLTLGVDFIVTSSYLAFRASRFVDFSQNFILVRTAFCSAGAANQFVLDIQDDCRGTKFVTAIRYVSQTTGALSRAAAQYCGLFVFEEDDYVVSRFSDESRVVYTCLRSGQVEITYPHAELSAGQHITKGTTVCHRFSIETATSAQHIKDFFAAFPSVSLDYVLPFKGILWDPREATDVDFTETDAEGDPHPRIVLGGSSAALSAWWATQKEVDARSTPKLCELIGLTLETPTVHIDFAVMLWEMYGNRLLLVGNSHSGVDARLSNFLAEYRITGAVVLRNSSQFAETDPDWPILFDGQMILFDGQPILYNLI